MTRKEAKFLSLVMKGLTKKGFKKKIIKAHKDVLYEKRAYLTLKDFLNKNLK